jgi:hypothetical protein
LRKYLVLVAVVALLSVSAAAAFADITPKTYTRTYNDGTLQIITHPYGFWNNPITQGREAYNYNNPQDYTSLSGQGPHGNYSTSTHKCRECHAVHRASGKFKLMRADSRTEACDWCHGDGAGSGYNIQMDNDDAMTQEYNVGHTMGFGVNGGRYKAPDDTYPAYTPKYYLGGFSCIDCHSPHGNRQRVLGFNNFYASYPSTSAGQALYGAPYATQTVPWAWQPGFGVANPGRSFWGDHNMTLPGPIRLGQPVFRPGSWILVKNPNQEIAWTTITPSTTLPPVFVQGQAVIYGPYNPIPNGAEIPDLFTGGVYVSQLDATLPVNKTPVDWERALGGNAAPNAGISYNATLSVVFTVNEFCADCHDGNAGQHTIATAMYSEDRAARDASDFPYDIAYSHDSVPRH